MVTAVVVVTMGLRLLLERALPRFGAGSRPMLGIYAVHVVLVAASVVLNPLACIYAFVGYLDSYRFFSDQQLYVLVITTAMLCAVGQTGGIGVILEEPLLFAGIAAVNLFLATLMLYMSMVREKEVAERERTLSALQQATQENDALQEELLRRAREAGVDEERARLSREIHDTVAQGLVGVIRQRETVGGELEADAGAQETGGADGGADGGDVRRRIALAEEAARDCLVEARRAVEALAPYQLTEAGTAHGLGELVARWARAHRIVATFDADDAPSHGPHAAVLVRIAQEALANVARHSGAQTVTVTLSGSEEEQSLQVTDDGRGFDVETITRGHGLANMAQRVEEVGGRLHLSSHERRGASVIATVPGGAGRAAPAAADRAPSDQRPRCDRLSPAPPRGTALTGMPLIPTALTAMPLIWTARTGVPLICTVLTGMPLICAPSIRASLRALTRPHPCGPWWSTIIRSCATAWWRCSAPTPRSRSSASPQTVGRHWPLSPTPTPTWC